MVRHQSVCCRRLAGGRRRDILAFNRFLANRRVTVKALIEGWSEGTSVACAGLHVLAIQDTSDLSFRTTPQTRRGLGPLGKSRHGLLLHAMLAVDAGGDGLLGLVAGEIWNREGLVETPHSERLFKDKESQRWLSTAKAAKAVLSQAAMVTEVSDRESDIYAKWALVPHPNFYILTRAMHDRSIKEGGRKLSSAALLPAGEADIELRERPGRPARTAHLVTRYGKVTLKRPKNTLEEGLPKTVTVTLVEVMEVGAPQGAEPILWRLLTTHAVEDANKAWLIVDWYRKRWIIEQFFRTLNRKGYS